MRILAVSNLYPPIVRGGAELIASYICEGLQKADHELMVLTTSNALHETFQEQINGVSVVRYSPSKLKTPFKVGPRTLMDKVAARIVDFYSKRTQVAISTAIDEFRPDIVHSHNTFFMSDAVWTVPAARGIPVVHTAHDYRLLCLRGTLTRESGANCSEAKVGCGIPCGIWRAHNDRVSRSIDVFCSPSQYVLDVHADHGLNFRSTRIVRNAIPFAGYSAKQPDLVRGFLGLLYIGALSEHKGVHTLLKAFEGIPTNEPISLVIAGRGELEGSVKEASRRDPRITFLGFVSGEDKKRRFAEAHALVLPSEWPENAPVSVIEAFEAGLPVVAARIGGIPEMVQDGYNGVLTRPGDASDLCSQLVRLSRDRAFTEKLSERAAQSRSMYTVDRMVAEYNEVYDTLVANG